MNNYWKKMYGERSKDFIEGVLVAIDTFAVWHDGKQYIGVAQTPKEDEVKAVKEGLGWKEDWDK